MRTAFCIEPLFFECHGAHSLYFHLDKNYWRDWNEQIAIDPQKGTFKGPWGGETNKYCAHESDWTDPFHNMIFPTHVLRKEQTCITLHVSETAYSFTMGTDVWIKDIKSPDSAVLGARRVAWGSLNRVTGELSATETKGPLKNGQWDSAGDKSENWTMTCAPVRRKF
jgi:hypothetical protein